MSKKSNIKSIKNKSKVEAGFRYTDPQGPYVDVVGLTVGNHKFILFNDQQGTTEYWTPKDIEVMYAKGHDSIATLVGMDFLKRSKLISPKREKEVEKQRMNWIESVQTEMVKQLDESVEDALAMKDSPVVRKILLELKDKLDKGLG